MEGRDNRLNAKNGFYVDASYQLFREALGSEFNFDFFQADVRYYVTPFKKLTIATQIRTEAKSGDVPVQTLSQLGGDYAMRGTYRGRYRDLVALDTQLELRFPLFWIFGATVFNSLGQVAPAFNKLSFDGFHYNYGLGLRLKVDSVHDVNLRFDYGISSDQTYFIINFSEAF
jgi:outer membrane translocation and assembly module TamA